MSRFTKDVLLGINIAVRGVSKKYPFIVGWELPENAEDYNFTTYINLLINLNKIEDFFGVETRKRFFSNSSSSLSSFIKTGDPWLEKERWQKDFDFFFDVKKEIQRGLTNYYQSVPEEYSLFIGEEPNHKKPDINIDNFVVIEKNPE